MLHELSTGQSLFSGTSDFEVMKRIVEAPIRPPSTQVPGYPAELDRIVCKALAREPARRYATARELQLDIERFALEQKLPISTARLAGFMEREFADRIAAWRQRASLEYAARTTLARPPSVEVEIIDRVPTTQRDSGPFAAQRRWRRYALMVGSALAGISLAVVAQRQLAGAHAVARAPVVAPHEASATAPAPSATASPEASAAPSVGVDASRFHLAAPIAVVPPVAPPEPWLARAKPAPRRAAPSSSEAVVRRHRPQHHAPSTKITRRAATKSVAAPEPQRAPQDNWNPEDGLPPGSNH